ncbi:adenine phosphoribosyltransferase [Planktothrix sp. FACHB-1355]|uniref:phosphoribosyltransferase family protein n=1 Tax=Planktothrix sp. FACHB-1355 TaxID=2692854 RepID=UPI00168C021F|nr:phosphoribosyltransferase family protein [Planktothrix sp. FACHB-1355]MBD3557337.1 adenine phosphoribosyltransferase [Planktothrix sp. FACHB-1355]
MAFSHDFYHLTEVYKNAQTVWNDGKYTTVNELCDQIPALRPEVVREAVNWFVSAGIFAGNKIVTEEDKGAILAGLVMERTEKPLAVARWYPYQLPESATTRVYMKSEYREGDLYLNGVLPGDRVTIIEDTISSGGTIIALVEAIRKSDAEVVEILALIEKIGFGGVEKVYAQTGILVQTGVGIKIDEFGCVDVVAKQVLEGVLT